jgi:hypothetical protein
MTFKELPTWAKGVIAVVGVVAVGGVGFAIYKAFKKFGERKDEREVENATQSVLNQLESQGITPTLNDADALTLARYIETALTDCETVATEKGVIARVSEAVKNQADWQKLVQTFGVRKISDCMSWTDTEYDLKSLLLDQLDSFDTYGFGRRYSEILVENLKAKGVNI